jgi:hypothetical protein
LEALDGQFAATYLVFDCDVQDTDRAPSDQPKDQTLSANFEKLMEMAQYFTNDTDPSIGKLYLNFPMMESFKDCNAFFDPDYAEKRVKTDELTQYKEMVNKTKISGRRVDRFQKDNFDDLIRMNLFKLNKVMNDRWQALSYQEYLQSSEEKDVLAHQKKTAEMQKCIDVLNMSLFLPVDYYGERNDFFRQIIEKSTD